MLKIKMLLLLGLLYNFGILPHNFIEMYNYNCSSTQRTMLELAMKSNLSPQEQEKFDRLIKALAVMQCAEALKLASVSNEVYPVIQ